MADSGEVILTRNLFINTEQSQYSQSGDSYRTTLPPSAFSCKSNQKMRLTLTSFEMRKNWYEVNNTNNTFFMFCNNTQTSPSLVPVIIPPGTYRSFGTNAPQTVASIPSTIYSYATNDLCSAIKFAVDKALSAYQNGGQVIDWTNAGASTTNYTGRATFLATAAAGDFPYGSGVSWNTVTRKFTITLPNQKVSAPYSTDTFSFIFPQIKTASGNIAAALIGYFGNTNSTTYGDWTFQDSHQLLGGRPVRDVSVPPGIVSPYLMNQFSGIQGLTQTGTNIFTSPYVGQLNTIAALYLRLYGLQTANYQAPSLDRNMLDLGIVEPTSIFARIPMVTTVYDDNNEMISWSDSSIREHRIDIDSKQISTIQLGLTDDKSRPIAKVGVNQGADGMQHYRLTLKFEIIQLNESLNKIPPSLDILQSILPVGYNGLMADDRTINDRQVDFGKKMPSSQFRPANSSHRGRLA